MHDRAAIPAYRLLAVMAVMVVALTVAFGFDCDRHDLPLMIGFLGVLVGVAMVLRARGFWRTGTAIEASVLILAGSMATACLSILFAATALPYRDAALETIDRWLVPGFGWMDMYRLMRRHDAIVTAMSAIYSSLLWQPFALMAVLAAAGQERRAWRFVHAWFLALILSVAIFALVPALSAYPYHHLHPADIPGLSVGIGWRQQDVLEAVRGGALRSLTPSSMAGIITFPSFHAAASVLLFWGYRRTPWAGPPLMAWNMAMCLTAPLIGSHYFCDVAGGIAVALLAIRATRPAVSSARDGGAGGWWRGGAFGRDRQHAVDRYGAW